MISRPYAPSSIQDERVQQLFQEQYRQVLCWTDRLFAWLLWGQWLAALGTAIWISPLAWAGTSSQIHLHVHAAAFLGLGIILLPILLAVKRPGCASTRLTIAAGQALMSALLIHLTGGRIETHFHVFGSLALLAFYRDWRVLLTASAIVAADHFIRGLLWPQSVYGTSLVSPWRFAEHAGWVLMEDIFLFLSCRQGLHEMWSVAERQMGLERTNQMVLHSNEQLRGEIDQRQRTQEELVRAKSLAERANQAKGEFLANMSHEIRTPLNSVLGFSELMRRGSGSAAQQRTYLDTINSSGRHLLVLIDDILDLSKIEAGRMEFEQVRCSPHQIITEVLSVLRVRAQEKCLSLECHWTSGVPETILTDPARLRQLLINLVGNAIKFTDQGHVRLVATLAVEALEPRFLIEVHDSGIGIPAEQLDGLFTPFKQADSSITRRFGGTGLGLAICRHIAEGLGGNITVESQPGRGSIFRVKIETGPLDHVPIFDAAPAEAITPANMSRRERVTKLPPGRILLVEDGENNRELISLVLQEAGATVGCAENGQQGLEAATRERFDLILMDMQMPVMDGYTAARRLRDSGYKLPIIALTAHAMRGDQEKCLEAGCSGYLSKPIDIDNLLQTVAKALGKESNQAISKGDNRPGLSVESHSPGPATAITSTLPTDRPQFRRIVENFVDRLQEKLGEMQAAYDASDLDKLTELAHWLRGAGGTIGFDCFTEPARRLEQLAKQRQTPEIDDRLQELVALADRITVTA